MTTVYDYDRETGDDLGTAVAVVGMALRCPGAPDVETFWRNLCDGVDSIADLTEDDLLSVYDDPAVLADTALVRRIGLLDGIENFDADYFGFTPREAELMDPQQRFLLEVAVEALDDAGHDPARADGTVGAFLGIGRSSYFLAQLLPRAELLGAFARQVSLFNDKDFAATHLAHRLDLTGPAMTIGTACSTSLVTVHQAVRSLLDFECDVALAGGATINVLQRGGYRYQEGNIFSPDGRCRPYSAAALGTVGGSGVGVVVLKRLDEAVRNGDCIRAVIRGSAVNNDGAGKVGFTAPSVDAQAAVVFEALQAAGVDAASIGLVEGHGTATPMGDPIEVAALTDAFRAAGAVDPGSCALGSVKSNVGHLDTAAGVAGLIKAVLCVERGWLPPSLHFDTANPAIDFASSPFYVNNVLQEWVSPHPRRAGVSSFGMGGTNAHVVVEQPPVTATGNTSTGESDGWQVLPLSAKSRASLARHRERVARHLRSEAAESLVDTAFTLQTGRGEFAYRTAVVGRYGAECAERLVGTDSSDYSATPHAPVAFCFAGQGSQFPGMAAGLYAGEQVFRAAVDDCAEVAHAELGIDLVTLVCDPTAELVDTRVVQPALFAVQYALTALWRSWGIEPAAMVGHSIGECVAAAVAGVWSARDAMRVVCWRADLMQAQQRGAMLAVALGESAVAELAGDCVVAAVNSPLQTVLSGTEEAVAALSARLVDTGVRHHRLVTSHAFHSPLMEPMLDEFVRRLRTVPFHRPSIRFGSNVTGTWITDEEALNPEYWGSQVRSAVRYSGNVIRLLADEPEAVILEVGPSAVGTTMLREHDEARSRVTVTSMRRKQSTADDLCVVREALARLWVHGADIDWAGLHADRPRRRVPLPAYAFDSQRHWIDRPRAAPVSTARLFRHVFGAQPRPEPIDGPGAEWIVFADDTPLCEALLTRLRASSHRVTTVVRGPGFARLGADAYQVRLGDSADAERLYAALPGAPLRHLVYLWSADPGSDDPAVVSVDGPIALARALGLSDWSGTIRLAAVTRGQASADGIVHEPEAALVLGPVKTLPLEYPSLRAAAIDVGTAEKATSACTAEDAAAALIAELTAGLPNAFVAIRGDTRLVEQVQPLTRASPRTSLRPDGVYLITGAFGGIGSRVAQHLTGLGPVRLALFGRTPVPAAGEPDPDGRAALVAALEAAGAEVVVETADVTDAAAVAAAVTRVERRFGVIHGVLHAAGIAGGGLAQFQIPENVRRVLAPKTLGTRALAAALHGRDLDFFAVFSSVSALLGGFGQLDYCAANAFADAWANSAEAPPNTVVIDWDTWWDTGMASTNRLPEEVVRAHAGHERAGFPASDALGALERALFCGLRRVIVSTETLPGRLASGADRHRIGAAVERPVVTRTADEVEQVLIEIWRGLLGREQIDRSGNFFELGGDSVLILEAGRQVRQRLEVTVSVADLFGYPTISQLAAHLSKTAVADLSDSVTVGDHGADTDIAVIGMALRLPGARSADEFWANLMGGVDSLVPTDEPAESAQGTPGTYVAVAGAPEGVDLFDAAFFGFTPREAELMDPQQRLLLTCSYEALEDAGYRPREYPGRVGVYAGTALSSYLLNNLIPHRDDTSIDPTLVGLGNEKDFAATTVAYRLDLRGPAVSVGTACSTSLVAVVQACRALIARDCDVALAAGAKVRTPERSGYFHVEGSMTSPDGKCRPYSADARGTVFTSGAGVVVLKRLSDAMRDGDSVRAVIRGSAVNNDGAGKVGFTAPSVGGQAAVVLEALRAAGVDADSVGLVEGHGTATPMGDPIEVAALSQAFRAAGAVATESCALGSVKSNVGHLDAAAGVTGLIKAVLCVERGWLPPSLHFDTANPAIDFASSPFFVNNVLREWSSDGPRRAGVSSFGIGGTNAHVVVEQPPAVAPMWVGGDRWEVLVASGKSAESVLGQRARLTEFLRGTGSPYEVTLSDVAFTAQTGRDEFGYRVAAVGRDRAECADLLAAAQPVPARPRAQVVFLLGSYPLGGLLDHEPVFRTAITEMATLAERECGLDLLTLVRAGNSAPLVATAVSIALARLWQSWGIRPCAVIGDDEYATAVVAGVLSAAEAVRLACYSGTGTAPAITPQRPKVRFASTATGEWIADEQAMSPAYWTGRRHSHTRPDVSKLLASEPDVVLLDLGGASLPEAIDHTVVTMTSTDPMRATREALAQMWLHGVEVDWAALHADRSPRRVPLPTYVFDLQRYWIDPPGRVGGRQMSSGGGADGSRTASPGIAHPRPALRTPYVAPSTEAERRAVTVLEQTLGISPIGVHDDFFELGGSSMLALQVVVAVAELFGVTLPSHAVLDAPTAAGMAVLLADSDPAASAIRTLVTLNEGVPDCAPLFLIHPIGGSVYFYRELAAVLPPDVPVHAFQAAGLDGEAVPRDRIEDMAQAYLAELRKITPHGPYRLAGASFGGLVALELAHRLRTAGEDVELLALFDTPGPGQMPPDQGSGTEPGGRELSGDHAEAYRAQVTAVYRANTAAMHAYDPQPYPGLILYFLAELRRPHIDPPRPDTAWVPLARGGLLTHRVPGDHVSMLEPPHVATIGQLLTSHLIDREGRNIS
ncbi:SDR family NAD(P)-dependent oxidoreductase [Nocardia sp. bgisy118]|uniref:type I polyketide synthase n=1 Tax=Nocardia sp. bgisy118 TaxID=3413786 RepID=UPI003F4A4D3B